MEVVAEPTGVAIGISNPEEDLFEYALSSLDHERVMFVTGGGQKDLLFVKMTRKEWERMQKPTRFALVVTNRA